jgi:lysophospholipase L1-like esterase
MKRHNRIIVLASLILCACTQVQEATKLPPGSRYVSLGSSFAAGAGIGPIRPGTPERCGRTTNNYASLLAEKLELTLDDQGCGGAKTEHVLGPWNEVPAQIDAVTSDTKLVTITIGGNDLNYVGSLFAASCSPDGRSLIRPTASCGSATSPGAAGYARAEENLRAIAAAVRLRAPQAILVFVQYVTLVPESRCNAIPLSADAAATTREIGKQLASITERVAEESEAILLPADQLSRSHTPCDPAPWATGLPPDYDRAMGAPWHPNAAGHAAIAEAIAKRIRK